MVDICCRLCGGELNKTLIDLGKTPLANSYIEIKNQKKFEPTYELHARVCEYCFLVQIGDSVPPKEIFSEYAYYSSYSDSWIEHARGYVEKAVSAFALDEKSFVVEVASNDGYLLQHFIKKDIPVLGVEPALNIASAAEKKGIPTLVDFFGKRVAREITSNYGKVDLTVANNVLAHVPDINDFMSGFEEVLKADGVASFEFPHLLSMIKDVQFDTIYHEHFSYLSLLAVENCLERHNMRVFDVEQLETHGGSLRVWCCKQGAIYTSTSKVDMLRALEEKEGLDDLKTYDEFSKRADRLCQDFVDFLEKAKFEGKKVVGYGAAAKGNTFLNRCQITSKSIEFVVDANPYKQGKLLPGSHIPIFSPDRLFSYKPDYVIILPWNLKHEIVQQINRIRTWGGKFVVASPAIEVW